MPANRGEEHHRAKLTEIAVLLIHFDRGPVRDIARRYGVSPSTVSQIKNERLWSWLPRIRHRSRIRQRERPAP